MGMPYIYNKELAIIVSIIFLHKYENLEMLVFYYILNYNTKLILKIRNKSLNLITKFY